MIKFDAESHKYSLDGVPYVSVTQLMEKLRLTPPYPEEDRGQKELGTAIHKAVELASLDRLDMAKTSPVLLPYVEGFLAKKQEMKIRPIVTELQMWDPHDGDAGTMDLFCCIYDKNLAVIDYKSGSPPDCCELQTAGYERLLRRMAARRAVTRGIPDDLADRQIRRFSMKLTPGRALMKEYTDPFDHIAWDAALTLYKWKYDRRKQTL